MDGWVVFFPIALALFGLWIKFTLDAKRRQERFDALLQKYGDADLANMLMNGKIAQGMTQDMLVDSWGLPEDISERIFRRKTRHIYKYNRSGKNRYRSKVKLEDGIIIGWDQG